MTGVMIHLGLEYPGAGQIQDNEKAWQTYLTQVYTMGGAMPDMRTRGELLLTAYRTIQPKGEFGQKDWDEFYRRRDEFKEGLIPEDRALLEQYIESRMTEIEQKYNEDMEALKPYWNIEDQIYNYLGTRPGSQNIKAVKDQWEKLQNDLIKMLESRGVPREYWTDYINKHKLKYAPKVNMNGQWLLVEDIVENYKQIWRDKPENQEAASALRLWYSR